MPRRAMGHRSRIRSKPEIIHRKKLFDGRETAEEIHRRLAFGGPCTNCGGPPVVKIVVMAPLVDVMSKMPEYAQLRAAVSGGHIHTVKSRYGELVRLTKIIACDGCKKAAIKAAARPPRGWRDCLVVDIDTGPGADKTVVQVPATMRTL